MKTQHTTHSQPLNPYSQTLNHPLTKNFPKKHKKQPFPDEKNSRMRSLQSSNIRDLQFSQMRDPRVPEFEA